MNSIAPRAPENSDSPVRKASPTLPADTGAPKKIGGFLQINPLVSIWKHKFIAGFVALLVTAAGVPLAFKLAHETYRAQAVVLVAPRFVKNLKDDQEFEIQSNSQYREFVQQQVKTINRYDIVEAAFRKLPEEIKNIWRTENETERQSIERLQGALDIKPVPDTYQITIGLEGHKKKGLAEIVNCVVEEFVAVYKNEEFYRGDDRAGDLQSERERLTAQMQDKMDKRTALVKKLSVTTLNDSVINPYDQLLTNAKTALAEATRGRIVAETELAAVNETDNPAARRALDAMAREIIIKDNGLNSLKASLYQRRADLLAKISPLGAAHPARIAAEKELAEIETEIERAAGDLMSGMRKMIVDRRRSEVERTREVESGLKVQVEQLGSTAAEFSKNFQEAINLGDDLERDRKQLDAVQDRLEYLGLERQAPGFVRSFAAAQTPLAPYKGGGRKKYLLLFAFAGLFIGLAVPVGIDFLDPRIRFIGDLEKLLKLPTLGWIIDRRSDATETLAEDQLMRLAAAIERDHNTHETATFVFTAVKPQAGVSELVLALARDLNDMGVRTLAVEANAMNPDARYLPDRDDSTETTKIAAPRIGLASLLAGDAETAVKPKTNGENPIFAGEAENLSYPSKLQIGELHGRRHLPQIHGFKPLLEHLRQFYDVILIDAPPLHLSSDAESLVNCADCALLVVEAEAVNKTQVRRAVAALEKISPKSFGTILTRVRVHRGDTEMKNLLREYQTGKRPPVQTLLSRILWH